MDYTGTVLGEYEIDSRVRRWEATEEGDPFNILADEQAKVTWDAAIREVVEFIVSDEYYADDLQDGETMPNEPTRYFVRFSRDNWQAQLKHWAIDDAE